MKARAALYRIIHAEETGLLTPGKPGTIVEATAGNTGISLAQIARARGYNRIIVIPETQPQPKKDALLYAGAQLVQVRAPPISASTAVLAQFADYHQQFKPIQLWHPLSFDITSSDVQIAGPCHYNR